MAFMNYKCQPVALATSVANKKTNVDAKLSQYYLLFAATWRSNFQFVLVFRRIGRSNVLNSLLRRIAVTNDLYC